jgi:hypothetical protein
MEFAGKLDALRLKFRTARDKRTESYAKAERRVLAGSALDVVRRIPPYVLGEANRNAALAKYAREFARETTDERIERLWLADVAHDHGWTERRRDEESESVTPILWPDMNRADGRDDPTGDGPTDAADRKRAVITDVTERVRDDYGVNVADPVERLLRSSPKQSAGRFSRETRNYRGPEEGVLADLIWEEARPKAPEWTADEIAEEAVLFVANRAGYRGSVEMRVAAVLARPALRAEAQRRMRHGRWMTNQAFDTTE